MRSRVRLAIFRIMTMSNEQQSNAKPKLPPKKSLRPKYAAQLLGVAQSTLWRYAKEIPGFPAGRRLSSRCTVFDEDELIKWRDSQITKN